VSVVSAGCPLRLQRLQPVLALIAAAALSYQVGVVGAGPRGCVPARCCSSFWGRIGSRSLVALTWIGLWLRYR